MGQKGQSGRADPNMGDAKNTRAIQHLYLKNKALNYQDYANADGKLPLTPQEEEFAQYVALGYNYEAAGRLAYGYEDHPLEWSPGRGCGIARRPRVSLRIQQLLDERRAERLNEAERLRDFVTNRLEYEAMEAGEGATRLKALEMLGKINTVNMFSENHNLQITDKSTVEEIQAALMERLKAFTAKLSRSAGADSAAGTSSLPALPERVVSSSKLDSDSE